MEAYYIRKMKKEEYELLEDFLYEAIFQRDEQNLAPRDIIKKPELSVYIDNFGTKKDDFCLLAEVSGKAAGAVWVRVINGYGHTEEGVPEFAISLYREYRGKGIGTRLMEEMLKLLRKNGYQKTSLAVQKDNYALRMYQKTGFQIVGENEEEYIMVCNLTEMEV